MEDENAKSSGEKDKQTPRKITLKDATSLLKAEALRRYRQRHKSSLDRHEQALEDEFSGNSKPRKSPAPNSPPIAEEGNHDPRQGKKITTPMEDDVFSNSRTGSSVEKSHLDEGKSTPLSAARDNQLGDAQYEPKQEYVLGEMPEYDIDEIGKTDYGHINTGAESREEFEKLYKKNIDVGVDADRSMSTTSEMRPDSTPGRENLYERESTGDKKDVKQELIEPEVEVNDNSDQLEILESHSFEEAITPTERQKYEVKNVINVSKMHSNSKGEIENNKAKDHVVENQHNIQKVRSEKGDILDDTSEEKEKPNSKEKEGFEATDEGKKIEETFSDKSQHDVQRRSMTTEQDKAQQDFQKEGSEMSKLLETERQNQSDQHQDFHTHVSIEGGKDSYDRKSKEQQHLQNDGSQASILQNMEIPSMNQKSNELGEKSSDVKQSDYLDVKVRPESDGGDDHPNNSQVQRGDPLESLNSTEQMESFNAKEQNPEDNIFDSQQSPVDSSTTYQKLPLSDKDLNDDKVHIENDKKWSGLPSPAEYNRGLDKMEWAYDAKSTDIKTPAGSLKDEEIDSGKENISKTKYHDLTSNVEAINNGNDGDATQYAEDWRNLKSDKEFHQMGEDNGVYLNKMKCDNEQFNETDKNNEADIDKTKPWDEDDLQAKDLSPRPDDPLAHTYPLSAKPKKRRDRLSSAALLDGLLGPGTESESQFTEKSENEAEETQEPAQQVAEAAGQKPSEEMDKQEIEPPLTQEITEQNSSQSNESEEKADNVAIEPTEQSAEAKPDEQVPSDSAEGTTGQEPSKPETQNIEPNSEQDTDKTNPEQAANPETQLEEAANPETQAVQETNPETQAEQEANPETQAEQEANPETQAEQAANPETQAEQAANPETQAEQAANPDTQAEQTANPETQTEQGGSIDKQEEQAAEVAPQEQQQAAENTQQSAENTQLADESTQQQAAESTQQAAESTQQQEQSEVDKVQEESAEEQAQQKDEGDQQKATGPVDGNDPNIRGDEDEVQSQEILGGEEEEKIPDDFYYNFDDHMSKPIISEESGLPSDLLVLHHSYGYDCQKRANLHILDQDTALFAAGNLAQIVNFKTKEQTYLRSTSGGGLGAIAVHPSKKYFAIGEKGVAPNINIFEYPSLKLYRILRGGTQESYSFVDFSPDGKLLASVGGDPDFMLTLWEWKQEKTVLRSKAFSQDVFRVTFSTELDGQLTSSGTGHIRFWKMAKTFTGLKLQGQLGKFGKTEITDIEGYVELPDGKVLSGSEWGNLLLWDGGLIKVEISRKNKKSCHNGVIQQIVMDEGELMTVGADGYIRVWDFETVDTADVTDEASVFEMEPMNELKVGNGVSLRSIVKSADTENEPTMWYAQDANGAVWKLDLSFSFTSQEPDKLMKYHAGQINGCAASPVSDLVATIGQDHFVFVYDYVSQAQLCRARYNSAGTSLLWAPQIVDPKGATILAGFADGVVRVLVFQKKEVVDVHGRKKQNQSELALKQAFKPHNKSVVCMAIDNKGELLATGSDDCTIFFFTIGDNYEPIGFMKTPSAVTHIEWSPSKFKKQTLLVSCAGGEVLEVAYPEPGKFDTSHTFEITGLNVKTHQFKSVKSHLRHEEELERKAKEEEERKKREAEERKKRIERGLETESEQGDEPEEEEKPAEEEWQPFIPSEPSPILNAIHAKEEGQFWVSMGEFDAGYLYKCQFEDDTHKARMDPTELYHPVKTLPMHGTDDVPVKSIKFSKNRKFAIMGLQNGAIRVQPVTDDELQEEGLHWTISAHDNQYGQITHIEMSHDNKYIFSVGADGNFFVFEFMDEQKIEEKVKEAKAKIPSARKELAEKIINDIEDPSAYSIEDAKQKAEHDKMVKLAEQKKASVRKTIKQMRDQFKKLIDKNTELPEHLRLDRKEFEMDPEIKRQLARHTQEKIETVRKEMAWEEEKHRIALEKLKIRFKDVVECERIVVKAIHSPHEVSSFRASKLPDDFYQAKANMDKRKTTMFSKDGDSRQQTQELLQGDSNSSKQTSSESKESESMSDISLGIGKDASKEGTEREDTAARVTTTLKGSMGERITKSLMKVEEKKKKRAARRAQWSELYSSKPDDNYEDPKDVSEIKDAQENMGDYKLKSADDYVVPDHLRMNTDKARARLLVLKDLLHKHKYDFNQQLLSLRDKKMSNIDQIKELRYQLEVVQSKLDAEHHKPIPEVPRLYPEEIPEKKYEYTRETLLKFKSELETHDKSKGQTKQNTGFGGLTATAEVKSFAFTPSPVHGLKDRKAAAELDEKMFDFTPHAAEPVETEMELKLKQAEEIRLLYEQDRILQEVNDIILNFDAELKCLRHNKFKLDVDLKNADLRHVTLFEEFLLLRDFEKHENVLVSKLESKQQEKFDMQEKIVQVQAKIETKKKEIEKLVEREKALQATFVASLGDNNKFQDYLTKVFKKKIKRSKKKVTEGDEDDDEDSEEESSDESDWEESDEESDSEAGGYDLDVCPPGCDQNMYDNTCALREKRLDIEEALAEMKKDRDACNKEHESYTKKSKIIDSAVKQAENELEAFQLEKQRKLNELDVVVQLKLHQIQHTINNQLPQDLSQCLVFEQPGVIRLTHRIKELEQEKGQQKKHMRESKRKHVQLIKDRKLFDAKITEMRETTDKMMIQKFGKIVDLEKLETVTVNRQVEELKEKLRVAEIQCSSEVTKWNEKISSAKDNITDLIKENTNKLDQLNMLLGEKKEYEGALDSRQKNLGDEYGGVRKSDVNERQRLIQLVHLQAQEVEALKEEITLLSRKGGHILPPAQPPLPQSSQGNRGSLPPN